MRNTSCVGKRCRQGLFGIGALGLLLGLSGCSTPDYQAQYNFETVPVPGVTSTAGTAPPSSAAVADPAKPALPATAAPAAPGTELLRVGDPLTIVFSDIPTPTQPFEERIKDDGTITLLYNQTFVAAGKLRGDLEREIRARYVPDYFKNLTVTIKTQMRFYYVGGEVKAPGEKPYLANMTLTKAIQAAGDVTDFADKKRVQLTRVNGEVLRVSYTRALENPRNDPPVFPGDKIHVPRRWW